MSYLQREQDGNGAKRLMQTLRRSTYSSEEVLLTAPRSNGPFSITTDASERGIDCMLMQEQEGELRIQEFGLPKFSSMERIWDTRERGASP